MYTIKQAALRSGVAASLIRAWERRYGVVHPDRTPGGYRLYDETAIARLRAMRGLIEQGWSAAQAATAVVEAVARDKRRTGRTRPKRYGAPALVAAAGDMTSLPSRRCSTTCSGVDRSRRSSTTWCCRQRRCSARRGLRRRDRRGGRALGEQCRAPAPGGLFEMGGVAGSGPRVLVGLPPDSRHELGALAFAVALRRMGADVLYLGSDVPIASWVNAAEGEHGAGGHHRRRDRPRRGAGTRCRMLRCVRRGRIWWLRSAAPSHGASRNRWRSRCFPSAWWMPRGRFGDAYDRLAGGRRAPAHFEYST